VLEEPSSINKPELQAILAAQWLQAGDLHMLLVLSYQNVIHGQLWGRSVFCPVAVTITLTGESGFWDIARGQRAHGDRTTAKRPQRKIPSDAHHDIARNHFRALNEQ
jgi:hypothetical protein